MGYLEDSDSLWKALANVVADEGLFLYDVERFGEASLRVFIGRPSFSSLPSEAKHVAGIVAASENGAAVAQAQGVTSADCSRICRRLMVYFAVEGAAFGLGNEPYMEVCSPGVNRNLRRSLHFRDAVGERMKVVSEGIVIDREGHREEQPSHAFIGKLEEFNESSEMLLLALDDSEHKVEIPFQKIRKASIEFKF